MRWVTPKNHTFQNKNGYFLAFLSVGMDLNGPPASSVWPQSGASSEDREVVPPLKLGVLQTAL